MNIYIRIDVLDRNTQFNNKNNIDEIDYSKLLIFQ